LALALFEPSSALGLSFVERLAYFSLIILPILGACVAATSVAFRLVSPRGPLMYVLLIACGVVVSVAASPYTLMLERAFKVQDADDLNDQTSGFGALIEEAIEVVPTATVIWLLLNQLVIWSPHVGAAQRTPIHPAPGGSAIQPSVDLSRFGVRSQDQLIALEAQQHYLRVYTTEETHFVLYGINAAIEHLATVGLDGMLVHRSYWVNWRYVAKLESRDGQYRCMLVNGMIVPIARRRWTEACERFQVSQAKPQAN
jgi:hypothetical protein